MKSEEERLGREELEECSGMGWEWYISGRTQGRKWLRRKKDPMVWEQESGDKEKRAGHRDSAGSQSRDKREGRKVEGNRSELRGGRPGQQVYLQKEKERDNTMCA